jgi:cation diffusion facilitator CzcD-associated flavoprotein CzcO
VTGTPDPAEPSHPTVIVGAGAGGQSARTALLAAGLTDVAVIDDEPVSSVFDDGTDTWRVCTAREEFRGRVVIAANLPPFVPWTPEFPGRNDFRGISFHAARWDSAFNPTGRHIAVIGPDASAGHRMARLTGRSASVTVFPYAPRRIVSELPSRATRATRWLRRRAAPGAAPSLVASEIAGITPSAVRTRDGIDHPADVIVYGTGFTVPEGIPDETLVGAGGLTIRQAWDDGMEPYFGIAVHGFPNYFFIGGPDLDAQARHIAECVRLMRDTDSTRIEVRHSSQRVFNERACLNAARPPGAASAFDLSSNCGEDRQTYDGAATLTIAGVDHSVRVRLTGRLDPIDGEFHWQGTVFASPSRPLPDQALQQSRSVTLTVGDRNAPARIVEKTPWGTHSVAGVGAPPYASH